MSDSKIILKYRKYTRQICKILNNNKETLGSELLKISRKIFGNKFVGIFSVDKIPLKKILSTNNSYFIYNTDLAGNKGIHWCAGYHGCGKKIYLYDSFGRKSKIISPILYNKLMKGGVVAIDSDLDSEQTKYESICGQYSVAWLLVVKNYGIKKALLI